MGTTETHFEPHTAPMPAPSETLPVLEQRLAEHLLGFELLDMPPRCGRPGYRGPGEMCYLPGHKGGGMAKLKLAYGRGSGKPSNSILRAEEIEQLARFDEHWRVILAGDNRLLALDLAQRGYLDMLKRRVPLYRLNDLGREALRL